MDVNSTIELFKSIKSKILDIIIHTYVAKGETKRDDFSITTQNSESFYQTIDWNKSKICVDIVVYNQSNEQEIILERWTIVDHRENFNIVHANSPKFNLCIAELCRKIFTFVLLMPSYLLYKEMKKNPNINISLVHFVRYDINSIGLDDYEEFTFKSNDSLYDINSKNNILDIHVQYCKTYKIPTPPVMTTSRIIDDYKPSSSEMDIPKHSIGSKSPNYSDHNLSGNYSRSPSENISGSYGKSPSEILRRRTTSQGNKISPFLNATSPKSTDIETPMKEKESNNKTELKESSDESDIMKDKESNDKTELKESSDESDIMKDKELNSKTELKESSDEYDMHDIP